MKASYLLYCLSFLLLSSCSWFTPKPIEVTPKDDKTQLPPETQEGKNTFGCLVNGQVWRNQGRGPYVTGSNLSAIYNALNKTFQIEAIKRIGSKYEIINIQINNNFKGVGVYNLKSDFPNDSERTGMFFRYDENSYCEYRTDSLNTGILEITHFDSIAPYIVSGRFSFTVATPGCDTVRVTDGRFDIRRN